MAGLNLPAEELFKLSEVMRELRRSGKRPPTVELWGASDAHSMTMRWLNNFLVEARTKTTSKQIFDMLCVNEKGEIDAEYKKNFSINPAAVIIERVANYMKLFGNGEFPKREIIIALLLIERSNLEAMGNQKNSEESLKDAGKLLRTASQIEG